MLSYKGYIIGAYTILCEIKFTLQCSLLIVTNSQSLFLRLVFLYFNTTIRKKKLTSYASTLFLNSSGFK